MGIFRRAQAFYGNDLGAFQVNHLSQAGAHRLAVDDDGAGTAGGRPRGVAGIDQLAAGPDIYLPAR
jgi:hypothetical protein